MPAINQTSSKHFTVAGGKTGAALKEAAKRESLAKSDKDKADLARGKAKRGQVRSAAFGIGAQIIETEAKEQTATDNLAALKSGKTVTLCSHYSVCGTGEALPYEIAHGMMGHFTRELSQDALQALPEEKRKAYIEQNAEMKIRKAFGGRY